MAGETPTYPKREYELITHSDSSRFIRARMRAFWSKGQQLWDSDMNNSLNWWGLWMPNIVSIHWKGQKDQNEPPYYSPELDINILDPDEADVPDDDVEDCVYYNAKGQDEPFYYKPLNGAMSFAKADRILVGYQNGQWHGVTRLLDEKWNMEIAVYVKGGKAGKYLFAHKVSQPFRFYADVTASRVRGISVNTTLSVQKNGIEIGTMFQGEDSSGLTVSMDIDFAEGDILSVFAPADAGLADDVSLSIMGSIL